MSRLRLGLFFALTYAISWAIWIPMAVVSFGIGTPVSAVLNIIATAGPSIAAIVLALLPGGGQLRELVAGFSPSRLSLRWALVAVGLPLAMIAVAIAVGVTFLGSPPPTLTLGVVGLLVVEFVRVLFLGGPLEEEIGSTGAASLLYVVVTWLVAAVVTVRFGRRTLTR